MAGWALTFFLLAAGAALFGFDGDGAYYRPEVVFAVCLLLFLVALTRGGGASEAPQERAKVPSRERSPTRT